MRIQVKRDETKRQLSTENADLYAHLVHCCLESGDGDESTAFEMAVAGKSRAFVDMLATTRFDISAAEANNPAFAADWQEYNQLLREIDHLLIQQLGGDAQPAARHKQELDALQQKERKRWQELVYKYPALTATQAAPTLDAKQAQELADELGATVVEFVEHKGGWSAFVVTKQGVQHVHLPSLNQELLREALDWINLIENPAKKGELESDDGNQKGAATLILRKAKSHVQSALRVISRLIPRKFRENFPSFLKNRIGRKAYLHPNQKALDVLTKLHKAIIAPLRSHLPKNGPLILAPFGDLHLLPLHAAFNPDTETYLDQEYVISFTPSLSALSVALAQVKRDRALRPQRDDLVELALKPANDPPERLLNVAYPGQLGSLDYLFTIVKEAKVIARLFKQVKPLYDNDATVPEFVKHAQNQDIINIFAHNRFDPSAPEHSGLMLRDGNLTVQRIITQLNLQQTRLVTLAACRTGQTQINQGEEMVGLIQALMTAKAQAVVAGLWKVGMTPTQTLFKHFYENIHAGQSPAEALRQATQHVRSQPGWEHPYYWAAFQVSGLAHELPML